MLSHDMEKLLTFANERHTALIQEAAAARLCSQQETSRQRIAAWPQALGHWWRRLTHPAYPANWRSLAES